MILKIMIVYCHVSFRLGRVFLADNAKAFTKKNALSIRVVPFLQDIHANFPKLSQGWPMGRQKEHRWILFGEMVKRKLTGFWTSLSLAKFSEHPWKSLQPPFCLKMVVPFWIVKKNLHTKNCWKHPIWWSPDDSSPSITFDASKRTKFHQSERNIEKPKKNSPCQQRSKLLWHFIILIAS